MVWSGASFPGSKGGVKATEGYGNAVGGTQRLAKGEGILAVERLVGGNRTMLRSSAVPNA